MRSYGVTMRFQSKKGLGAFELYTGRCSRPFYLSVHADGEDGQRKSWSKAGRDGKVADTGECRALEQLYAYWLEKGQAWKGSEIRNRETSRGTKWLAGFIETKRLANISDRARLLAASRVELCRGEYHMIGNGYSGMGTKAPDWAQMALTKCIALNDHGWKSFEA